MYFTLPWHRRKHHCCRWGSVRLWELCCTESSGASPHLGSVSKASLVKSTRLWRSVAGLFCQCFRVTRAVSFWNSGSRWRVSPNFSSQSVLPCTLRLAQGTAGAMLAALRHEQVCRENAFYASEDQKHLIAGHRPAVPVLLETSPSSCLPPSRKYPCRLGKNECFKWALCIFTIVSLYSWIQRLQRPAARMREQQCRRASLISSSIQNTGLWFDSSPSSGHLSVLMQGEKLALQFW